MLQFLFDTDHLTLFQHGHPKVLQRLASQPTGSVGVTIITMEEAVRGRLARVSRARTGLARVQAYSNLLATWHALQQFLIAAYDASCEIEFQKLRALRLRIGSRDQKIAAVTLAGKLTLITRNRGDFSQIPNLVIQDWST